MSMSDKKCPGYLALKKACENALWWLNDYDSASGGWDDRPVYLMKRLKRALKSAQSKAK